MTIAMVFVIPLYHKNIVADYALIDVKNYPKIGRYRWHLHKNYKTPTFCAARPHGKHHILMHREILGLTAGDGIEADHRNGNGLDNRGKNLRRATRAQNQQNRHRSTSRNPTSPYRGVFWDKSLQRWHASVRLNGKNVFSRTFKEEKEAAEAAKAARLSLMPFTVEAE